MEEERRGGQKACFSLYSLFFLQIAFFSVHLFWSLVFMSSSFLRCLETLGYLFLIKARRKSPLEAPRPGRGLSTVGSQQSDQAGLVLEGLSVLISWGFFSWVGQSSWRRLFCFPPECLTRRRGWEAILCIHYLNVLLIACSQMYCPFSLWLLPGLGGGSGQLNPF